MPGGKEPNIRPKPILTGPASATVFLVIGILAMLPGVVGLLFCARHMYETSPKVEERKYRAAAAVKARKLKQMRAEAEAAASASAPSAMDEHLQKTWSTPSRP